MRTRLVVPLCIVLLTSSRIAEAQTPPLAKRSVERARVEPGIIMFNDLEAIARRVGALCAEPERIVLHVGDTLVLSSAAVVAYDSLGAVLGKMSSFDSALLKRTHLVPTTDNTRRYVAISAGEAEFALKFPQRKWIGCKDDPVSARLIVEIVPR